MRDRDFSSGVFSNWTKEKASISGGFLIQRYRHVGDGANSAAENQGVVVAGGVAGAAGAFAAGASVAGASAGGVTAGVSAAGGVTACGAGAGVSVAAGALVSAGANFVVVVVEFVSVEGP
jgi:hypothetical protein